jgi:hypothetical protein
MDYASAEFARHSTSSPAARLDMIARIVDVL